MRGAAAPESALQYCRAIGALVRVAWWWGRTAALRMNGRGDPRRDAVGAPRCMQDLPRPAPSQLASRPLTPVFRVNPDFISAPCPHVLRLQPVPSALELADN